MLAVSAAWQAKIGGLGCNVCAGLASGGGIAIGGLLRRGVGQGALTSLAICPLIGVQIFPGPTTDLDAWRVPVMAASAHPPAANCAARESAQVGARS